jgi:DNA-binding winged helix-turn-helix (wHTH) protein
VQFLFTDHTLDTDRRELLRGSECVAVEPQVFDLLIHLVQNRVNGGTPIPVVLSPAEQLL